MKNILYNLSHLYCAVNANMDCGNAPYCGVLVLSLGESNKDPFVNGLWPLNSFAGSSKCVTPEGDPSDDIPPSSCYNDEDVQKNVWQSHGICAASNPVMYFNQVCSLSTSPLIIVNNLKIQGKNINDIAKNLQSANYEVYNIDSLNDQLELSVCAGLNTVWVISSVKDFGSKCGSGLYKNNLRSTTRPIVLTS